MSSLKHQTQPNTAPVTSDGLRRNQLALEALIAAAGASGVLTFNTRSGAVTLTLEDVRAALGLTYAGNALKVIRVNAAQTAFELAAAAGGSAASTLTAVAGEALSGNRAVYIADDGKAYHADKNSATSIRTAGLTTGAVSLGATATIQVEGPYTEVTWSWTGNGVIWLSTTGQLTQTPPTTGYLVKVGVPAGPTQMLIEPQFVAQF